MERTNKRLTAVFSTIGAGVLIFFGGLWLLGSILSADLKNETTYLIWFGITLLIMITVFIMYLRKALKLPKEEVTQEMKQRAKQIRKSFRLVNIIQWVLIVGAFIIFQVINRDDLMIPVISIIIGLHFYALAPVFNFKFDYLIGTLMILWSVTIYILFSFMLHSGNKNAILGSSLISLGDGIILWIGAINRFNSVYKILRVELNSAG